ncbi:MAG: D-2-hydroxyacid dehydrogenase [bacterium]|nr:D-2-hydroxyacid dehydrogenase [bacterium]
MKIVALDTAVSDFDDLKWEILSSLGEFSAFPRTTNLSIDERAKDAQALIVNKVVLNREIISRLPALRYIGVCATGYNNVDIAAAQERGIAVTNVPGYSTASVAQLVFAFILEHYSRVSEHSEAVISGSWSNCPDFSFQTTPIRELAGKTIAVVGWGAIGQAVGRIAEAFEMKVVATSVPGRTYQTCDICRVPFVEALASADIVTLHCPLTDRTKELINSESLGFMKKSALLINTGRGPLINEQALADALNSGQLAAAALDVLCQEPPGRDNPLLSAANVCITPHIGWATREARERLRQAVYNNLADYLAGKQTNRVDS